MQARPSIWAKYCGADHAFGHKPHIVAELDRLSRIGRRPERHDLGVFVHGRQTIAGMRRVGAAEFAGLGGAGDIGNIAGEIGAVTEALPLLKQSAAGLGQSVLSAASTIGPLGVAAVGVGVGLAHVKLVAKLHEGNIKIDNKYDRGTKIDLKIPI